MQLKLKTLAPAVEKTEAKKQLGKGEAAGSAETDLGAASSLDEGKIRAELNQLLLDYNKICRSAGSVTPRQLYDLSWKIKALEEKIKKLEIDEEVSEKIWQSYEELDRQFGMLKLICFNKKYIEGKRDREKYPDPRVQVDSINADNFERATACFPKEDVAAYFGKYSELEEKLVVCKDPDERARLIDLLKMQEAILLHFKVALKSCLQQLIEDLLFDECDDYYSDNYNIYKFTPKYLTVTLPSNYTENLDQDFSIYQLYSDDTVTFAIGGAQLRTVKDSVSQTKKTSRKFILSLLSGEAISQYNAKVPVNKKVMHTQDWLSAEHEVYRVPLKTNVIALINDYPMSSLVFSTLCYDYAKKIFRSETPTAVFIEGAEANRLLFATAILSRRWRLQNSAPSAYSISQLFEELRQQTRGKISARPLDILSNNQKLLLLADWFNLLLEPIASQNLCAATGPGPAALPQNRLISMCNVHDQFEQFLFDFTLFCKILANSNSIEEQLFDYYCIPDILNSIFKTLANTVCDSASSKQSLFAQFLQENQTNLTKVFTRFYPSGWQTHPIREFNPNSFKDLIIALSETAKAQYAQLNAVISELENLTSAGALPIQQLDATAKAITETGITLITEMHTEVVWRNQKQFLQRLMTIYQSHNVAFQQAAERLVTIFCTRLIREAVRIQRISSRFYIIPSVLERFVDINDLLAKIKEFYGNGFYSIYSDTRQALQPIKAFLDEFSNVRKANAQAMQLQGAAAGVPADSAGKAEASTHSARFAFAGNPATNVPVESAEGAAKTIGM